ncbi:O-antigen ligase family protein [Parabacteroides sp. AGMB00274]|uniref:O-antigen ligase family protein n=1 Tax=Parabacteroides faecalis TaxID=2924040 RepID=A0ABT0C2A0_9BACT|nr:O-antigen ligase family protein [Parabacteroides faecalis]MCJ2381154.1 O-antigen ligase family protein [Parabacteroides faecalis]
MLNEYQLFFMDYIVNLRQTKQPKFRNSVAFMFIVYWAILVAWQNISGTEARTGIDSIIKMGLLFYFVRFYILRMNGFSSKIGSIFLLSVVLLLTAFRTETFSLSIVIAYIYPVLFMSMVYGIGDRFVISKPQLISFCNCVIVITLYAVIYAIIFCWDQFQRASSVSQAYGNELRSFFYSSHEYGLYLVSAIVSCFICLIFQPLASGFKKKIYIICMALFVINLLLTFSRTSIFALLIFMIIFSIVGKGKLRKWIRIFLIASVLILVFSADLSNFFYSIILKENNTGGRDVLLQGAFQYFSNGSIIEKIFGFGITTTRAFFGDVYEHGSVHNGYAQILLYYGIFGLVCLIIFIWSQIVACMRLIKRNRLLGALFLGLVLSASAMMFANTSIIFNSSIDSYFLTIFMFIVPKYVRNAIRYGVFE